MPEESLAAALEREHREIDAGIAAFVSGPADDDRREALGRAVEALRRHIYLEEEFLFPPMRGTGLMAPVFVMEREHGQIWHTLDLLEPALRGDGPADSAADACAQLMTQLDEHNSKEEPVIYPQADAVLSPAARADLSAFIGAGRMPEGWVCRTAR